MSRTVILLFALACTSACSKTRSDSFNSDEAFLDLDRNPEVARPASSKDDLLAQALAAASARLDPDDSFDDPAAARECPNTKDWQKFTAFAAPCGYVFTTDIEKLPSPPEWQTCPPSDGIASGTCKQFKRSRKPKFFHLGPNSAKEMEMGFVEACNPDQIVLAHVDGPTRFAIRRPESSAKAGTCPMKLLAVDLGQWLMALGGPELSVDLGSSGYTQGGAIIGGAVGATPSVLHSSADPFHVATSQGDISNDGWTADGKRRHWNGKPFEKTPRVGLRRLTKSLVVDDKKGIYSTNRAEPELLWEVLAGHTITDIVVRDQQIVWQEESLVHGEKTCTLLAGDLDTHETLTGARRLVEMPCSTSKFAVGCNNLLWGGETHLSLVSLANASLRTLRIKARPAAIDCREAFVERGGILLRIDLAAFGVVKTQIDLAHDAPRKTSPRPK